MKSGIKGQQNRFDIRVISYGSDEYRQELALRDAILRRPIGLDIRGDDLAAEKDHHHIGCFLQGRLAGVLVLVPLDGGRMKMRQVAVAEDLQRQGAGTAMVRYAEEFARLAGCRAIVLHARREAVPFYQRLGYEAEGPAFLEVGIPHRAMEKIL